MRKLREQFRRTRHPSLDTELLNWGAPRAPELELEADLPVVCRDYLLFLLEQAPDVVVKEVRMYRKLPLLAARSRALRCSIWCATPARSPPPT